MQPYHPKKNTLTLQHNLTLRQNSPLPNAPALRHISPGKYLLLNKLRLSTNLATAFTPAEVVGIKVWKCIHHRVTSLTSIVQGHGGPGGGKDAHAGAG